MNDYEIKREFLFSYLNEKKEEKRLADELEQIRETLTHTTQIMSGMPHGGQPRDMADGVQRLIEAEQELNAQISRSLDAKKAVSDTISAIPDARQRLILSWRFINGHRLGQIAAETHYSIQHVKRLYHDGINSAQMPQCAQIPKDETK